LEEEIAIKFHEEAGEEKVDFDKMVKHQNFNSVSHSNLTVQNYDEFSEKSFDAPPKTLHKKQQSMMTSPS